MNNKQPSPSAVLCYVPEDDWLARGIADGIEEKEFYIQLKAWCVHDVTKLWQEIREYRDNHTHFLILLTQNSAAKMWPKVTGEGDFFSLAKEGKMIAVFHCIRTDNLPDAIRPLVIAIDERCDVAHLVKYIKKLNTDPDQLFAYSNTVSLNCTSTQDKNRTLTSDDVQIGYDVNQKPVIETDKVIIIDKCMREPAKNTAKATFCLSEFDYVDSSHTTETVEITPAPHVKGLGYLTLEPAIENSIKNRTNKRITATLSVTATDKVEDASNWKSEIDIFIPRLLAVLEFAQGGRLFCPITELRNDGEVKTTFLCHGESSPQFMPVLQRGEDLKCLINKVIDKQTFNEGQMERNRRSN